MTTTIWTDVADQYAKALPGDASEIQDFVTLLSQVDKDYTFEIDLTNEGAFEAQRATLRVLTRGSVDDIEAESKFSDFLEAARFCQVHSLFTRKYVHDIPKRANGLPDLTDSEWESVSSIRRAEHIAKSTRNIVKDAHTFHPLFTGLRTDATGYIVYLERGLRVGGIDAIDKSVGYDDLRKSVNSLCDATRRFYVATHQGQIDRKTLEEIDSDKTPPRSRKRPAVVDGATPSSQGIRRSKTG